jgi:Ser/Thr protein kinase RdoA (MazF antagonist)
VVYRFGIDGVVKVPQPGTPAAWLRAECGHLQTVEQAGAPCPRHARVVGDDRWTGLACERIDGLDLNRLLRRDPTRAAEFGRMLFDLQRSVFVRPASFALPRQRDRLRAKLVAADHRHSLGVDGLLAWIERDGPVGLCHGDLHPSNVVLGRTGPVLVDWFDVGRGLLGAEIARTLVLLESTPADPTPTAAVLAGAYREAATAVTSEATRGAAGRRFGVVEADLDRWYTVQLAARLAEDVGEDRLAETRDRLAAW